MTGSGICVCGHDKGQHTALVNDDGSCTYGRSTFGGNFPTNPRRCLCRAFKDRDPAWTPQDASPRP